MDLSLYNELRARMLADPVWARQIHWSETVTRPISSDAMARELIFVIANSGMKSTVAAGIFRRVMAAIEQGDHPSTVFGHAGKAAAMAKLWQERDKLFQELGTLPDSALPDWCGKLSHIGDITRWHAAKNLGANVAKPDRWLERVAEISHESVECLCARLSRESGDRVATVDLVIWWATSHKVVIIADGALQLAPIPRSDRS